MIARELIEEARDYRPQFRNRFGGERAPLRELSRLQQNLAAEIAMETPETIARSGRIGSRQMATVLEDPANRNREIAVFQFITVISNIRVSAEPVDALNEVRVAPVSLAQQYAPGAPFPSIAFANNRAYLTDLRRVYGGTQHGWEQLPGPILYHYVPLPSELRRLEDVLDLPAGLRGPLVTALAKWMAARLGLDRVVVEIQHQYDGEIERFLDTTRLMERGASWSVLDAGGV